MCVCVCVFFFQLVTHSHALLLYLLLIIICSVLFPSFINDSIIFWPHLFLSCCSRLQVAIIAGNFELAELIKNHKETDIGEFSSSPTRPPPVIIPPVLSWGEPLHSPAALRSSKRSTLWAGRCDSSIFCALRRKHALVLLACRIRFIVYLYVYWEVVENPNRSLVAVMV